MGKPYPCTPSYVVTVVLALLMATAAASAHSPNTARDTTQPNKKGLYKITGSLLSITDTIAAPGTGPFAKLHREENVAFTICTGVLRFEYMNDLNSASVDLQLFDISSTGRKQRLGIHCRSTIADFADSRLK